MEAPWKFDADPNYDGIFTISDIGEWLCQLFFLPGDSVLYFFILNVPKMAQFFEIDSTYYRGFISAVVSVIGWFLALGVLGLMGEIFSSIEKKITEFKTSLRKVLRKRFSTNVTLHRPSEGIDNPVCVHCEDACGDIKYYCKKCETNACSNCTTFKSGPRCPLCEEIEF